MFQLAAKIGSLAGRALTLNVVRQNIVCALDDWSTASAFDTEAGDVANMTDADIFTMRTPLDAHSLEIPCIFPVDQKPN